MPGKDRPPLNLDPPSGSQLKLGSQTVLDRSSNPLLHESQVRTVRVEDLRSPVVLERTKRSAVRELRELRRQQSAADAIRGLTAENEIYGFTKGQFSMLDLLKACLEFTGAARLSLSTWTAARHEIQQLEKLQADGRILGTRWLVDFTFARRDPQAAHAIRQTFGLDAIRVAQNHAKFALFANDRWQLVVRTSMNLNMNPRFEDFTIAHDPQLAGFLTRILDEIWSRQKRTLADGTSQEFRAHFRDEM